MLRWADLDPDPRLLAALQKADEQRGPRAELVSTDASSAKNNWSNSFADACAQMVAGAVRAHPFAQRLTVLPESGGSGEPPTITYSERGKTKGKKIDVLAGDLVGGLQVAISLKGVGFRDHQQLAFGKNLTGRLYELMDETRLLHEYRPRASVVGLYFVPLGAVDDKRSSRSSSSFADIVLRLRGITGRADAHRQDEWHRVDLGFVGLYVPGDHEVIPPKQKRRDVFEYDDPAARGVVRYFDVRSDPPRRGRPRVATTLTLEEMVEVIAGVYSGASDQTPTWADPEVD